MLKQASAPATSAFEPEHEPSRVGKPLSPAQQLAIAGGGRGECEFGEQLSDLIKRDRLVALRVGVDPDCDHRVLLIAADMEAARQSCVE